MLIDVMLTKPSVIAGAPPSQELMASLSADALPALGAIINLGTDVFQVIAAGIELFVLDDGGAPSHWQKGQIAVAQVARRSTVDGPIAMATMQIPQQQPTPRAPVFNGRGRM